MASQRQVRLLAASAFCWCVARSCGVLVHNEVLHRSTHLFSLPNSVPDLTQLTPLISPLLLSPEYAPSLQAGAFFPDWGYQCLSTDSDAEAAHWPPFLVASVEHVISKYGYLNQSIERSEEEQEHLEGLISFIFAIAAHQVQDATWHAIRLPTAFLAALAGVDFAGDETKAHRVLDFGGDFMMATRLTRMEESSRDWIRNEWNVPIKDIIAIYSRLGKNVNGFVLRYCTMRGLAALRSGLTVGPSLLDSMASQSPMFVNSLDDYYLGGLDEMTVRTVSCWSNLTRWFAHGIDSGEKIRDGWGICDLFRAIKARGGAGESAGDHSEAGLRPSPKPTGIWGNGAMFERSKKEFARIRVRTDKFGAEIYTLPPLDKAQPLPLAAPRSSPRELLPSSSAPEFAFPTYVATYTPYSHFGTSLSLGNFTSTPGLALAVGAPHETEDSSRPGEGNVYILPLSNILPPGPSPFSALHPGYTPPLKLAKPLLPTTVGEQTGVVDQRFGISSTAWHTLNMTLLAVAATGPITYDVSTPSLPFKGSSSAGRIDIFKPGEPSRWLALSIKGAELGSIGRRWWGEKLISADFSGSGSGSGSGEEWLVVGGGRGDGNRVCEGRERAQLGEGEVGIFQIISSPSSSPGGVEVELGVGEGVQTTTTAGITINAYTIPLPAVEKNDVPCSETKTYESFGASLSFMPHSRTLLIGAPGAGGVGKVFAYRFTNGQFVNVFTIASPAAPLSLRTRFGGSGMAAGVTATGREWIAIGASDEEVDGETQAGAVRVYVLDEDGDVSLVGEVVAAVVEDTEGRGGRKYGKFGRTIVADGVGRGVWVGSEYWAGETGGLWWVDIEAIVSSSELPIHNPGQQVLKGGGVVGQVKQLEVKLQMQGKEPNARFAASLAVGERGDLVVGIPYSGVAKEDQGGRFYGSVGIYERK